MSGRRIKNLIILILALAVCFLLLAVVPGKMSAQREESALHKGLTELLERYGVSVDPALLTPGETLYAIELGEASEADESSTRYEILYSAASGTVSLSRSGALHAELNAAVSGRSYEQDMRRRLRGMGYTVWQAQPAVRQEDGVYALRVEQALLGMPVFGGTLTFSYQNGMLCAADGVFYPESGSIARVSEEACISCADALTQILASRDALGWVGSQITGMQQGYLHSETATSALRFTPVWRVETDTTVFYVNGITREVRQAE